jgi:phosphoglycolate phosphatase
MIKNVVFDLDGTLLDTIKEITQALNETLVDFALPPITLAEGESFLGHGTEYLLNQALKGTKLDPDAYERFKAAYMKRQIAHQLKATRPFRGVPTLLRNLSHRGVRLFVYSNKPHDFAVTLTKTIFGDVFASVVGQKPGFAPKPNVDSFIPYLKDFGIEPKEALYVGDSLVDIDTARALGMKAVSVAWGYVARERLIDASPEFLIDQPLELLDIVTTTR